MERSFIYHLEKPCKNRGISIVPTGDGNVFLDGIKFETIHDAENYIEKKPRTDVKV